MFADQNASNMANWQIVDGMTVYDSLGDKVGTIRNYDPQARYLDVRKGWLFPKDIYVPIDAIRSADPDGIYLSLPKDELSDMRYENMPGTYAQTTDTEYAAERDYTADQEVVGTATTGTTDTLRSEEDIRVPVREEELVVGKQREELGRAHIHKDVVEEQETVDVPLQREKVTVERRAYSGDAADDTDLFQEKDIDIPVMGEEAVVDKRVHGVEEVRIHKDAVTDQRQASGTVRKERVVVDDQDQVATGQSIGNRVKNGAEETADDVKDRVSGR